MNINWSFPRICEVLWSDGQVQELHTEAGETFAEAYLRMGLQYTPAEMWGWHVC